MAYYAGVGRRPERRAVYDADGHIVREQFLRERQTLVLKQVADIGLASVDDLRNCDELA